MFKFRSDFIAPNTNPLPECLFSLLRGIYQLTNTTLPLIYIATVQKIISEILSGEPGMAFTREARDVLIECCVEFLTLISSEANEIAEKECKKTIATEHIEMALRDLGFPEYVEQVLSVAEEHKEQLKVMSCPGVFFLRLNGARRAGKIEDGCANIFSP